MKHLERALDGQNQVWKYILVFLIGFLATNFIGALPLAVVIIIKQSQGFDINSASLIDFSVLGINLNVSLLLMLIPFIVGLFVIIPLVKNLHQRSWIEVINGTKTLRWKRFFFSAFIWTIIMGFILWIHYLIAPQDYILRFNLINLIPLAIISLSLIPLQTFYEEFLFRGYFMQGMAAWTKNRWQSLIIPALLFGLMHILNPEIKEYGFWLTMPQYILFGLLFGIMIIMDDGIETAMGAHAANNIFLCLIVTSKGSALQTYALFEKINVKASILDSVELFITGGLLILILGIKYKWKLSVLNKKVEIETLK
ncbi:MAG: CPBP family intramembrane metalloprotease [Bacteroidales bacterium]|nr:CPBP family intramembrane metalloprotease [Bacteroidales bacterium]MDD4210735.1 CPBP family intramembrane metalloprotease [Bacteroidales bacterium]